MSIVAEEEGTSPISVCFCGVKTPQKEKKGKEEENGVERGGAVLESSGNDVYHVLEHMRQPRQKLLEGTL